MPPQAAHAHPQKSNMNTPPIRETGNSLPLDVKEDSIAILNKLLRKFLTLALLTKQAHWNLRGLGFLTVHEMLDGLNSELLEYADSVAERAVQLGGVALGTPEIFSMPSCACCSPYPTDIHRVEDHLRELHQRFSAMTGKLRKLSGEDSPLKDGVAIAILQDAQANLEKQLWFIEAQLG